MTYGPAQAALLDPVSRALMERRRLLLKRKRRVLIARDSLLDFAQYISPDPNHLEDTDYSTYVIAKHHRAIADAMQKVESGEIKRLMIQCPPRHGKTRLASHLFGAWYVGRNPGKHAIIGTYNEKFSWDHGREIRKIMRNGLYKHVFPNAVLARGSKAVDRLATTENAVLQFVGRAGTITGRGGDIIILDDPIKNRQEADSPTIRETLWNWYVSDIASRQMTKNAAIVIICTRWHEDDLVGRLTDPNNPCYNKDEAADWYKIDLPALAEADDPLGRPEGEPLWPSRFDTSFFANIRRTDSRSFQALYQGRPAPDDGVFFRNEQIHTYGHTKELPPRDTLRFYASSDHAVSTDQDRDATCLMNVAVDQRDNIYVLPELFWDRSPTNVVVEAMINFMEQNKPLYWWAEKGHVSKAIGPFLRKRMLERQIYCTVDEVSPISDKQQRAQSIQARMAMGKVFFPRFAHWWPKAEAQLLKFPRGINDDFVDALALIGMGLSRQFGKHSKPENVSHVGKGMTFGQLFTASRAQRQQAQFRKHLKGW